ncbi:MAG: hypothetical protein WC438_03535 [Candidatus Pacearchaeota archaeon]
MSRQGLLFGELPQEERESHLEEITYVPGNARIASVQRGDNLTFYRLCNEQGLEPEECYRSQYEQGRLDFEKLVLENNLGEVVGNIGPTSYKKQERISRKTSSRKSKNQDKYPLLLAAARQEGVRSDDVYEDIETKRKHLKQIMGYRNLIGSKGVRIRIEDVNAERIGKAYQEHINMARKYE